MSFTVAILTTGSEILDGRVVDTNSNFVAQQLAELGIKLVRVLAVDDDLVELLSGLDYLHQVADIIITSGGLGPTADDLTRDMAAKYVGVELVEHPTARKHLEDFYAVRKRTLDASNLRQAMLPNGSEIIPNPCGTAPGFIVTRNDGRRVYSLSGVPREFKAMFTETVLPDLCARVSHTKGIVRRPFRLFGLPESVVGKEVEALGLPAEIVVSYRAVFPEVHLVLKSSNEFALNAAASVVRSAKSLAPYIYSEAGEGSLATYVSELLVQQRATLAIAESCTGGVLAAMVTALSGASRFFIGGTLAYSDEVKRTQLGIPPQLLEENGAVCGEVAKVMAEEVRRRNSATYGIATTGIAGPSGGTAEKPVGTFYLAIAAPDKTSIKHCLFVNERTYVQRYAAYCALELIRRNILNTADHVPFPAEVSSVIVS